MKLFKNSKGELLRISVIECIIPIDQWVGDPAGGEDTTHVVCTPGSEFPLYPGDFERLLQVLETFQG